MRHPHIVNELINIINGLMNIGNHYGLTLYS